MSVISRKYRQAKPVPETIEGLRDKIRELRSQVQDLEAERAALEAQLAGKGRDYESWWQSKGMRQRAALDRLHSRVVAQRAVLAAVSDLERLPTRQEARSYFEGLNAAGRLRVEEFLKSLK